MLDVNVKVEVRTHYKTKKFFFNINGGFFVKCFIPEKWQCHYNTATIKRPFVAHTYQSYNARDQPHYTIVLFWTQLHCKVFLCCVFWWLLKAFAYKRVTDFVS